MWQKSLKNWHCQPHVHSFRHLNVVFFPEWFLFYPCQAERDAEKGVQDDEEDDAADEEEEEDEDESDSEDEEEGDEEGEEEEEDDDDEEQQDVFGQKEEVKTRRSIV